MLNISSSPPATWSPAPSHAVPPVSAATPVAPVQATARDAQTGSGGFGRAPVAVPRESSDARTQGGEPAVPAAEAAPLLPRPSPDKGKGEQSPAAESAEERLQAEAESEQQAREAREEELKQRLQDVISNAWKASAAVVDRALGRENAAGHALAEGAVGASSSLPEAGASTPVVAAPTESARVHQDQAAAANGDVFEPAVNRPTSTVVAYDAQGHSSLAPLEAGSLLSRRV